MKSSLLWTIGEGDGLRPSSTAHAKPVPLLLMDRFLPLLITLLLLPLVGLADPRPLTAVDKGLGDIEVIDGKNPTLTIMALCRPPVRPRGQGRTLNHFQTVTSDINEPLPRLSRRQVIKWFAAVAAAGPSGASFEGPPQEVLDLLDLEQTVDS